jgi:hypothetical protein
MAASGEATDESLDDDHAAPARVRTILDPENWTTQ